MEATRWTYFQYRRGHGYPLYVRFKQSELDAKFSHLLNELGFNLVADSESKKISLVKPNTKVLTIQEASPRIQQTINGSDLLDKYGNESLSLMNGVPIYTYRKVGIMAVPRNKVLLDLAINPSMSQTEQMVGMRVILIRFIAQSLSELGILCYWGTIKDDTVIVMKQYQSFGEAVVIDFGKKMVFSNGGQIPIGNSLKIIRKDKEVSMASLMTREELISFLSVSTCLLSFTGISSAMKKAIYDLSTRASGCYESSAGSF